MYRFYEILRRRSTPLTPEELEIAKGQKIFADPKDLIAFIDSCAAALGTHQQSIRESFARASEKNLVSFHPSL
jgi:hypothetical protein